MPDASATIPVVAPTGDLDLAAARDLGTQLSALAGTPGPAVLDLSEIVFMDSVGLGVVLKATERFRRQDKQLALVVKPDGNVARLLQFAGVRDRLNPSQTRDEALARVQRLQH
jgi:anti-anti-sigma factor